MLFTSRTKLIVKEFRLKKSISYVWGMKRSGDKYRNKLKSGEFIFLEDGFIHSYGLKKNNIPFFTHEHTGYGGNLFFGLKKAFEKGATHVIEIHGDGQYDLNRIIDVEKMLNDDKNIDLILLLHLEIIILLVRYYN